MRHEFIIGTNCPFCGSQLIIRTNPNAGLTSYSPYCSNEACGMELGAEPTLEQAISKAESRYNE